MKRCVLAMLFFMFLGLSAFAADWNYQGTYCIEENGVPLGGVAVVVMVDREAWETVLTVVDTGLYSKPYPMYPVNYYVEDRWLVRDTPIGLDGLWVFKIRSIFPGDEHMVAVPFRFWPLWKAEETIKGGLK